MIGDLNLLVALLVICWRAIPRFLVSVGIRSNVAVGSRLKLVGLKLREHGGLNGAKTRSATL